MKAKAERLFYEIGGIKDMYVTEEQKSGKRSFKMFSAVGICAAAAAIGIIVWGAGTFKEKPNLLDYNNLPFEYQEGELEKIDPSLSSGGMGFEGFMGYDVTDVTGANPINAEEYSISELPVLKIKGMDLAGTNISLTEEQTEERLRRYSEAFGAESFEITEKDEFGVTTEINTSMGDIEIWVLSDGTTRVTFKNPIDIPEGNTAEDNLGYFSDEFSEILGFQNPVGYCWGDYDIYSEYIRDYYIYEGSEDAYTAMYNYNFKNARFCLNEEGKLWIIWIYDKTDTMDCVGIYPSIDYETALERLLERKYVSTLKLDYDITEDMVKYCELTYHRTAGFTSYQMPYYRFLVEMKDYVNEDDPELKQYLAVYVPAVKGEYIMGIETDVRFN